MVVIPARDEEDVIARAVRSLPHDTVIVVDDASSDATAKIAREAGAGVLPAPSLPRGGTGKANACAAGAQHLTSRWILFADADTWFEPGFLEAAVAASEASGVSFLSVYPKPVPVGFLEHLLTPYLRALYFAGTNPKSNPAEAFNGQVVLARRETYEFLGGHNAILREAVDDIRLALARRKASGEVCAGAGAGALPYPHVSRRDRIVERIGTTGRPLSHRQSVARAGEPDCCRRRTVVAARAGLAACWTSNGSPRLVSRWCRWFVFGIGTDRALRTLLAPLAIYVALPFLAHALLAGVTGRPVLWKGRRV